VAYIPSELKKAIILPKFKKGNKNNILNYRPIANINILAKLLERNMLVRIQKFAYKHNLINCNQFAYQKNININEALLTKTDFIYNAFNENNNVLAIYLDLTRAFETINHRILLAKLENDGFQNKSLKLLENYLCNRKQITIVNNYPSNFGLCEVGVPQGTILGPWLFILFFNDIFKICSIPKIICFADDTLLLYTIDKNCTRISLEINSSLNNIDNWFDSNLLLLNETKSNFMIYSTTNKVKLPKIIVKLGNKSIKDTDSFKYLGLNFVPNLKWSFHINMLLTKLKVTCKFAYYLSKVLDFSTKIIWYYAFVYSLLANNIIILTTSNKNLLDKVQNIQYKIIKILFYRDIIKSINLANKLTTGTTSINIDLIKNFMLNQNLMNYLQIGYYNFITFIAKQKVLFLSTNKNRFNIGFKTIVIDNDTLHNRLNCKLRMPFYKKTSGQKKVDYQAAIVWNSIKVDTLASLFDFKTDSNSYCINKKHIKEYVSKISDKERFQIM
jgi:Reverse transcriptase (RNA-dependent DNA polymerase)